MTINFEDHIQTLTSDEEVIFHLQAFGRFKNVWNMGFCQRIDFDQDLGLHFSQTVPECLLCCLQRMRLLHHSTVASILANDAVGGLLSIRAIFEVTALVGYLEECIGKYYKGELTLAELQIRTVRIRFGQRFYGDDDDYTPEEKEVTSAVNVLTTLKRIDKFLVGEMAHQTPTFFSDWYARLCEFTHVNGLSFGLGGEADFDKRYAEFWINPTISEEVLEVIGFCGIKAQYCFLELYNRSWKYLWEREKVPKLTPAIRPFLQIDALDVDPSAIKQIFSFLHLDPFEVRLN